MLVGWNLPPGSCSLSHAAQTHTPSEGTELRQCSLQTPHFLRQGLPSQNSAVPMEPPELSYIVSGSINWQSLWKTENQSLQCLLELSSKDEATRVYSHDLAIPHLTGMCTYSIRNVLEIHSSIMCSTPNWKPLRCTSIGEWTKQLWFIHTTHYYTAMRKPQRPESKLNVSHKYDCRSKTRRGPYCMIPCMEN